MCNFFSGVVTPQGVFWCETWSHEETRARLGEYEEAIDVEYDRERGLEVHEPFRLPDWFDMSAVAVRVKELYEQLEPLVEAYEERKERIRQDYAKQINELIDHYDQEFHALGIACTKKIEEFGRAHPVPRELLSEELREQRRKIFRDYDELYGELKTKHVYKCMQINKKRDEHLEALVEVYRERFTAIEGYVPPRK
jgi:hypothetical protein